MLPIISGYQRLSAVSPYRARSKSFSFLVIVLVLFLFSKTRENEYDYENEKDHRSDWPKMIANDSELPCHAEVLEL